MKTILLTPKSENALKLLLSICYFLSLLSIQTLHFASSPNEYKLSIYSSIPANFFVFLILGTALSILAVIYISLNFSKLPSIIAVIGLGNIILNNFIFSFYTTINCAAPERGDMTYHLSSVNKLISETFIENTDFYPISHILSAGLCEITGLNIMSVSSIIFLPFAVSFTLSMYILGRVFSRNKGYSIFVGLASTIMVSGAYSINLIPAYVSILMLPLVLYIFYRLKLQSSNFANFMVIFIISLIFYPLAHPLTSFILLTIFVSLYLFNRLIKPILNFSLFASYRFINANIILIFSITFLIWISMFHIWRLEILQLSNMIFNENVPLIYDTVNLAYKADLKFANLFELAAKTLGGILVYLILSLVFSYLYLRNYNVSKKISKEDIYMINFSLGLIMLFQLIVIFSQTGIDLFRFLRYTYIFSTLLLGLIIFIGLSSKKAYYVKYIILCLLFVGIASLGMASYPSPFTFSPSPHIMQQDISGARWLIDHQNIDYPLLGIWPFFTYIDSIIATSDYRNIRSYTNIDRHQYALRILDHFGYDKHSLISRNYPFNFYLPIFQFDRLTKLDLWAKTRQFYFDDFSKLNNDISINLIYTSKHTEIWGA